MLRYLTRRLLTFVSVVVVISIGAFYLIHLLPGDPTAVILGAGASPANRARLNAQLGLNRPLVVQYLVWARHLLAGHFGTSFISETPVWSTLAAAIPVDVELVLLSQVVALALAVPAALRSARRPGGVADRMLSAASFTLLSVPSFILVVVLVLVVAVEWGVPHTGPSSYVSLTGDWLANLESLALPIVVLAIGSAVIYFRVLRGELIETLDEEFITLARSKGLSERRVLWRHALRPSSTALLGVAGVNVGLLLAGDFIVEYLLNIPGLGYTLVQSIGSSDYLVLQGVVLVVSIGVLLINFLVDLTASLLDPRVARE